MNPEPYESIPPVLGYRLRQSAYAEKYLVTVRTVARWIATGKRAAGHPDLPPLDDPGRMPLWWARHYRHQCPREIMDAALAASAPQKSGGDGEPARSDDELPLSNKQIGVESEKIGNELPLTTVDQGGAKGGYSQMLDRVRRAEAKAGEEFERLNAQLGEGRDEARIADAQRSWQNLAKQLREIERDSESILLATGNSIRKDDVKKSLAEIHGPVLNGMRSILRRIWLRLKSADNMGEADRIYQSEVDRVCSRLIDTDFAAYE